MYNTATHYYEKHDLESAKKWFEKAKGCSKNSNEQKLWSVGLNAITDKKEAAVKLQSSKSLKERLSEEEKEEVDEPPVKQKAEINQAIVLQNDISSDEDSDHHEGHKEEQDEENEEAKQEVNQEEDQQDIQDSHSDSENQREQQRIFEMQKATEEKAREEAKRK